MPSASFDALLRLFLTWWGVGVLAALDSTIVFALPFGIDAAMVVMGARHPELFWLYPLVGAAGSIVGAATTYRVGELAGEAGLKRFVPARRLTRIKSRVQRSGALALAALDLMPPPFPFTLFVVAAGALQVNRTRFFVTLAIVRLFRFGVESSLGAVYGTHIAVRIQSRLVRDIAGICILIAAAVSVVSIGRLMLRRHRLA
jgi:membrane protein YqaA with SNARE-associated domain